MDGQEPRDSAGSELATPPRAAGEVSVAGVNEGPTATLGNRSAHTALLMLAALAAWFPVETRPWTAPAVALTIAALLPWGLRGRAGASQGPVAAVLVGAATLVGSGMSGFDPARAVGAVALATAAAAVVWLASRSRPPEDSIPLLAATLAGLSLWGLWQATVGHDVLSSGVAAIEPGARRYALERISSGRAFASLPLPSHLAVLLATALPLLVARVRATPAGMVHGTAAALAVVGLALTRSPVGIVLALGAVAAVVVGGSARRVAGLTVAALGVALVATVVARSDLTRLEPVALRFDNWRTAVWAWSTAPADGVGLAGFAQATQNAPLVVGNRPAHAHGLPLEVLAELGPAGLAGCLLLALGLARLVVALWPRDRALAAALLVVPLHNLVDFSIFVSGVALPWAVLLGWGLARARGSSTGARCARGRMVLVAVAAGGLGLAILHAASGFAEFSAASQPDAVGRVDGALRALRLAPWRVEPQFLLASAALEAASPALVDRAWVELDRRRWWRPRSAALAERRARIALARGDASRAVAELWSAGVFGAVDREREQALVELLRALGERTDGSGS
ncbi:MAG: hypothetical protein MUC56_04630 [Thermoanaerobaculales bacterium]|nr:hypothetical protein [Thermoanaerobaculales bacterium]